MLNASFYNQDCKMDSAYTNAIDVFAERKPYKVETQFVGKYVASKMTTWTAEEIAIAGDIGIYYPAKVATQPWHAGEYKKVILFDPLFIIKVNEALEDTITAVMSRAEQTVFMNYLAYLDDRIVSGAAGGVRGDITVNSDKDVVNQSLDEWLYKIIIGKPELNPTTQAVEV